jgi:uncharacterized membrane protein
MTLARRSILHVTLALLLASAVSCAFLVGQEQLLGRPAWRFLVWNLLLAWIPFSITVVVSLRERWGWITGTAAGMAWLLFLPNAPYLITDLVHVARLSNNQWSETLSVASFAFTGLMLGLTSLWLMHERLRNRYGAAFGWLAIGASVCATGFGVALGRFGRLNSWDILTRPRLLAADVIDRLVHPFANSKGTAATIAVALLFGSGYLVLRAAIGLGATQSTGRAIRPAE